MTFALFDRRDELTIRHGHLPHWYQPGVTYFVTFRTADSVPNSLLRSWHQRREHWLRQHNIEPSSHFKAALQTQPDLELEFHNTFSRPFMDYLDRGEGSCPLQFPAVAQIVADNLRHFDGDRYHLGAFVVMPNHVHAIVCLRGSTEIESQCRSWKRFTATEINRRLGRRGSFWQSESFDHLVRSPE